MVLLHLIFLLRRRAAVYTSAEKLLSQLKSIGHTHVLAERCGLCVMWNERFVVAATVAPVCAAAAPNQNGCSNPEVNMLTLYFLVADIFLSTSCIT
jgi:hypothetical protein